VHIQACKYKPAGTSNLFLPVYLYMYVLGIIFFPKSTACYHVSENGLYSLISGTTWTLWFCWNWLSLVTKYMLWLWHFSHTPVLQFLMTLWMQYMTGYITSIKSAYGLIDYQKQEKRARHMPVLYVLLYYCQIDYVTNTVQRQYLNCYFRMHWPQLVAL